MCYSLYILKYENSSWNSVVYLDGDEVAYAAYNKLCEFAELIGAANVALCDAATGEVIVDMASSNK